MKQKILLDCTATLFSGLNTGIQRVVRNIIRRHTLAEDEYNIEVIPVVAVLGHFYEVSPDVILRAKPITASVGAKIKTMFERFRRWILTRFDWPKLILPLIETLINFAETILKKVFWFIKFLRVINTVFLNRCPRAKMSEQDVFVFLDAFWQFDLRTGLKNINAPRVVCVIYDLVPVYHSDYVEESNRDLFLNAMPWVMHSTHKFLCISRNVMEQIKNYCSEKNIQSKKFDYFLLGSDFVTKSDPIDKEGIRDDLKILFNNESVWLTVGTIEPRKNHKMILDAFDIIWNSGYGTKLLIIGRIGWKCEQIVERISNHPRLNKELFFLWDLSDIELQYAYMHSEGLIFASFAEGFGLPLVEAMASQIKVVCSEIPIFREVGGNYPTYFSLAAPENLVQALEQAKNAPKPAPIKWLSWDESVRSFMAKALKD